MPSCSSSWTPASSASPARAASPSSTRSLRWSDVDLDDFRLEIDLHAELVPDPHRVFTLVEDRPAPEPAEPPGPADFLSDERLGGDTTEEELAWLRAQRLAGRRSNKLFSYRALQNLRGRLLFRAD